MAKKLFFDFELGINKKYGKIDPVRESIQYLAISNGNEIKFYTGEIEELGPRPVFFPSNSSINRFDEELKLIYLILNQINDHGLIFCNNEKLKYLYYRSKRFGIRESHISGKIRLLKVNPLKITYKDSQHEITDKLKEINKFKNNLNSHWNILYLLFLEIKLNMQLIENYEFNGKRGIFEIDLKRENKKDLLGYLYGM